MPSIKDYRGLFPRCDTRRQDAVYARTAYNVDLSCGTLKPFPAPKDLKKENFQIRSLHWDSKCDCVAWDECDVSVAEGVFRCREFIWTGDGPPKRATEDGICEGESCPLGVQCPARQPMVTSAGGGVDCDADYTAYIYTFVQSDDRESAASSASVAIQTNVNGSVVLSGMEVPDDPCITHVRIYRAVTGFKDGGEDRVQSNTNYMEVAEIPVGQFTGTYTDSLPLDCVGPVFTGWRNYPPPDCIECITCTFTGHYAAILNKDEAWSIVFSKWNMPHAWPREIDIELPCRPVGLIEHGQSLYVFTEGPLIRIDWNNTENGWIPRDVEIDCDMPLCSKGSIAKGHSGVMFMTTRGEIVQVNQNTISVLANGLFDREDRCEIHCECVIGEIHNGTYYFSDGAKTYALFFADGIYANDDRGISLVEVPMRPTAMHRTKDGRLIYAECEQIKEWDPCDPCCPETECEPYVYETLPRFLGAKVNLAAHRVIHQKDRGSVHVKVATWDCGEKTPLDQESVEDCKILRLPACVRYDEVSFWYQGCTEVMCHDFGQNYDELRAVS